MKAELENARQLADLLDEFRPVERFTPEERGFIDLREQFEAFEASRGERVALRQTLPAIQRRARVFPLQWRAVAAAVVVLLVVAALFALPRLMDGVPLLPARIQGDVHPAALALTPDLCGESAGAPPADQTGLGGGALESGDFSMTVWLSCDVKYDRSSLQWPSEIDGLTVAYSWTYHGGQQDGRAVTFPALEPYMESIDGAVYTSGNPIQAGLSEWGKVGVEVPPGVIPDWAAVDARLRYVVKVQLPDGTIEGAALSFTLQREAEGFRPVDVNLEPLTEAERANLSGSAISAPPFPLLPVGDLYPQYVQIDELLARRQAELVGNGGWIHTRVTGTTGEGDGGRAQTETTEAWYLVDATDLIIVVVYAGIAADGSQQPVYWLQNGLVREMATGDRFPVPPFPYRTGLNLLGTLIEYARAGRPVEQSEETIDGRQVLVFSLHEVYASPERKTGAAFLAVEAVQRYGVDAGNGQLLFDETYFVGEDGSHSPPVRHERVEERISVPPDEIMAVFDEPLPALERAVEPPFHLPGAALWKGPKLAPDVCSGRAMDDQPDVYDRLGIGNLNGNLLGGGQLESGDFLFDYWLVCDFQFENSSRYLASEISGLAMALKWTYNGPGQNGPIVLYAGIEPYLNESSRSETAATDQSGNEFRGIELPDLLLADWYGQDTPLRYVVKAELPDGSLAGAALTFTLMREADGFRPLDIQLVPLSEVELASVAGVEVSEAPFALLDMDAEYPQLAGIHALLTQREQTLLQEAGWIHQSMDYHVAASGESLTASDYRGDYWIQVDGQGNLLAEVTQLYMDGRLVNQMVTQNSEADGFSADNGLMARLLDAARFGTPAEQSRETIDGVDAWVFTFSDAFLNGPILDEASGKLVYQSVTREAVDAQSGEYLFSETQEFDENGAQINSTRETWSEERVDLPPEDVLGLLELTPIP